MVETYMPGDFFTYNGVRGGKSGGFFRAIIQNSVDGGTNNLHFLRFSPFDPDAFFSSTACSQQRAVLHVESVLG